MSALHLESRGVIAATLVAVLTAGPLLAQATDPELAAGMRQVSEGDFEGAVLTLDAAARRLAADGTRKGDLVQAYVHLGIALVALDQRSAARERFRLAVALDPRLTLGPERYSPKVIGVFEEARREAAAETARAAEAKAGPAKPRGGGSSKVAWAALGVAGVAGGIVLVTRGGSGTVTQARFTGARFETPVLGCPDGSVNLPLKLSILVDAEGGSAATAVTSVSAVLIIKESPAVPGEVGFASNAPASVSPPSVPARTSTSLRVETTLLCGNGVGDEGRFNVWSGKLTLATSAGPVTLDTVDTLRVNIP